MTPPTILLEHMMTFNVPAYVYIVIFVQPTMTVMAYSWLLMTQNPKTEGLMTTPWINSFSEVTRHLTAFRRFWCFLQKFLFDMTTILKGLPCTPPPPTGFRVCCGKFYDQSKAGQKLSDGTCCADPHPFFKVDCKRLWSHQNCLTNCYLRMRSIDCHHSC